MSVVEYFKNKERSVKDIIGNRKPIYVGKTKYYETAKSLDREHNFLVVSYEDPFIPEIVYGGEDKPLWQHFLKRADFIQLEQPRSIQEAIANNMSPLKVLRAAFDGFRDERKYCDVSGYSWRGIRTDDKVSRVVNLYSLLKGTEYAMCISSSEDKGDRFEIEGYTDTKEAKEIGGKFVVRLPSIDKKNVRHKIELHNVPITRGVERCGIWYNFRIDDPSEVDTYAGELGFRFAAGVFPVTFYGVAAYRLVTKYLREKDEQEGKKDPRFISQPLPIPRKETIRFDKTMKEDTLTERIVKDKRGLRRIKHYPMRVDERCLGLGILIFNEGFDAFFTRTKLTVEDW